MYIEFKRIVDKYLKKVAFGRTPLMDIIIKNAFLNFNAKTTKNEQKNILCFVYLPVGADIWNEK